MTKKGINKINILSLICIILSVVNIIIINKLNIFPFKYLLFYITLLVVLIIFGIFLLNKNKNIKRIIGIILLVIISIVCLVISYYSKSIDNFIKNNVGNYKNIIKTKYLLISKNQSEELFNKNINYYIDLNDKDIVLNRLNEYHFNYQIYDDFNMMMNDLQQDIIDTILIDETSYNMLNSVNNYNYHIIYEFTIEKEEKLEAKEFENTVNIYIAGKDFTNLYNDFNMIITMDIDNQKMLLTGIPRDYYIPVYNKYGKDTLSYMGEYGVNTSIKSLESLLSIKIDYYIEINTRSLVNLVDTINGITYCSNEEFITTHSLVLDTYNDYGNKLKVINGCQELNGIETLTLARERLNITGGDTARQINCYKIMMAIFDKIKTTTTILNYNNVLNSISNLYKTNIPSKSIKRFCRSILEKEWDISYYELDGKDTKSYVHLTNYIDWVMIPNNNTIEEFKKRIKE